MITRIVCRMGNRYLSDIEQIFVVRGNNAREGEFFLVGARAIGTRQPLRI